MLTGLAAGWRRHRRPWPVLLGLVGGVGLYLFSFVWPSRPLAYLAIAGLIVAGVLNIVFARPRRPRELGTPASQSV